MLSNIVDIVDAVNHKDNNDNVYNHPDLINDSIDFICIIAQESNIFIHVDIESTSNANFITNITESRILFDIIYLPKFTHVTKLHIYTQYVDDNVLSKITSLCMFTKLKTLHIDGCHEPYFNWNMLTCMTNLTHLSLYKSPLVGDHELSFKKLTNLRSLSISHTDIHLGSSISFLTNLQELMMEKGRSSINKDGLLKLTQLTSLICYYSKGFPSREEVLIKLPNLVTYFKFPCCERI